MSATHYDATVEGHLDRSHWSHWFEGMDIVLIDDGNTMISGLVADQAALHGLLVKIRDFGLPCFREGCSPQGGYREIA